MNGNSSGYGSFSLKSNLSVLHFLILYVIRLKILQNIGINRIGKFCCFKKFAISFLNLLSILSHHPLVITLFIDIVFGKDFNLLDY